jgi:Tfp pilus assembly protein PilN
MIQINLLPKEYLKSKRAFAIGKSGVYLAAGAVAVVALLVGVTFWQMHQVRQLDENISRANQRAAMLRQDIQMVDALLDVKTKITRRMEAVERLDRHRSVWVRLLENVAENVPEFVWLGSFRQVDDNATQGKSATSTYSQPGSGMPAATSPSNSTATAAASTGDTSSVHKVEIDGYAFTLNAVAALMIKLMQSDYFDNVELVSSTETKFADDEKAYAFTLSANAYYLSDEELRNLAAQAEKDAATASASQGQKGLN